MGPFLVLVSAACFGAMAIFGKYAYAEGVTPPTLLLVRFALAAVLLWLVAAAWPGRRGRGERGERDPRAVRATRRAWLTAIGLGLIGYAAQASFYFGALEVMDASVLAILFYTFPALVTIASFLLGRESVTWGKVVALVIATAGTALLVLGAGAVTFPLLGTLLALGSAVAYTVYILVADTVVGQIPPARLAAVVMTGAAVAMGARTLLTGGLDLGFAAAGWFWIACIALVSTVLAMVTFFAGLARTGPSTTAILSTFEPVVTAGLAILVLGEVLTGTQLLGGLLVLAAVVVLQVRRSATTEPVSPPSVPA